MATVTQVTLVDSIDGKSTEDVETVTFFHPMTGQKMEIELNATNRKAMGTHLERMNKYFDAAVPVEVPVEAKPKAVKNDENTKIRSWAKENGFTIGDRGRISEEIRTAYAAAHTEIVTAEPVAEVPAEQESNDSEQTLTDDEILALMAEVESEQGKDFTAEDLAAKLDESDNQE